MRESRWRPGRAAPHRARLVPIVTLLAATLGASVLVGCGAAGSSGTAADEAPRSLDDGEAERLAQAGYANHLAGGSEFEANSAFVGLDPVQTVALRGVVDWAGRYGRAIVAADGPDAGLTEVYWDADAIYERRPELDSLIAAMGGPAEAWLVRPPDPDRRQLDRLVALVAALGAEQPENALLIQQTTGSARLRTDTLRGRPVEVLRYGTRNRYWLAIDDASMLRFEGDSAAGSAPTVIDLGARSALRVDSPPPDRVIPAAAVSELYRAVTEG
jgi:hypothetical protein